MRLGSAADRSQGSRRWVVWTTWGLLLALLVAVGVAVVQNRQTNRDTATAHDLADELAAEFTAAGLTPLPEETVVDRFGTDGGLACVDPGTALLSAVQDAAEGGAVEPGQLRPLAEAALQVERLVVQVYCPQNLEAFDDYVAGIDLDDDTTWDREGA